MTTQATPALNDIATLFGFVGDGTTDNESALTEYINDVGTAQRVLVFPEGTFLFDGGSTIDVPENIQIVCTTGALIRLDTTQLRHVGMFDAPPIKCIELVAGGHFYLLGSTVLRPEWWGAVPDAVTDCSLAFEQCLFAGPYREGVWSNGAALKSNCQFKVLLQTGRTAYPVESGYLFESVLTFPDYRSIHFDGGERHGARIINQTGEDYVWEVNGAFNTFQWVGITFQGLVFDRGGVSLRTDAPTINHSSQGGRVFKDCTFYGAPDYGIEVGTRYVWGWIERCTFDGCGGSINFAERDSDLWRVSNCSFLRETIHPSILVGSSGILIEECDFEVRAGTGLEQPFIRVQHPATDLRILHNRFGSEPVHPVSAIDFGESGDDTAVDPLLGIQIKGNQFKGYSAPDTNIAEAAIRFFKPIQRSQIIGNQIWSYTTVCEELFVDLPTQYARYSYDNIWRDNQLNFRNSKQIDKRRVFPRGGVGWFTDIEPVPNHQTTIASYIPTPDVTTPSWVSNAACTPSLAGTGPDGAVPSYYLERVAGGSCYVNTLPITVPEGEKMTFSVWAKAGTLNTLRLYAINGSNQAVTSFSEIFVLDDEWRQYHVSLEVPLAGQTYRFYIYNGADGTSETSGTIEVCDPRVHVGDDPYVPTWAQSLDFIDLSDYRTALMDAVSNHSNAFLLGMAHAAAAGRKLRVTPGVTWWADDVQPTDGVWVDARGATINGVGGGLAINDQVGVAYNIQGGTWNDGTVPSVREPGRYQVDNLAHWADTVSSHTGAGTLVSGRVNRVDPTAGPYTLDLPPAPETGDTVCVRNVTASTTAVTIDGNGNNIEGAGTLAFSGGYTTAVLVFDGTEWFQANSGSGGTAAAVSAPDEYLVTGPGGTGGYATIEAALAQIAIDGTAVDFFAPAKIRILTRNLTIASTITVPQYVSIIGQNCRIAFNQASGSVFELSGYNRLYGLEFVAGNVANTDACIEVTNGTDISIIECHLWGDDSTNKMKFIDVDGATWARLNFERCIINYRGTSGYAFRFNNSGVSTRFCDSWFEGVFTDSYATFNGAPDFGGNIESVNCKDMRLKRSTIRGNTVGYTGLRLSGTQDFWVLSQCNFDAAPGGSQPGFDIYCAPGTDLDYGATTAKKTGFDSGTTITELSSNLIALDVIP